MAEYRYRCEGCQHVFDVSHSVYADAVVLCPLCGDRAVKIFDSVPSIIKSSKPVQGSPAKADSKGENAIEEEAESHDPGCGCAWHRSIHLE